SEWTCSVSAVGLRAKAVQHLVCPSRTDQVNHSLVVSAALQGCAVEVPIAGLHRTSNGKRSVRAVELGAKAIESGQVSCRRDPENDAAKGRTTKASCAIEIAVSSQCQPGVRQEAIGTVDLRAKGIDGCKIACRRELEDSA